MKDVDSVELFLARYERELASSTSAPTPSQRDQWAIACLQRELERAAARQRQDQETIDSLNAELRAASLSQPPPSPSVVSQGDREGVCARYVVVDEEAVCRVIALEPGLVPALMEAPEMLRPHFGDARLRLVPSADAESVCVVVVDQSEDRRAAAKLLRNVARAWIGSMSTQVRLRLGFDVDWSA